jgi:hypothetical protein
LILDVPREERVLHGEFDAFYGVPIVEYEGAFGRVSRD